MSNITEKVNQPRSPGSAARRMNKIIDQMQGTAEERLALLQEADDLLKNTAYSDKLVLAYAKLLKKHDFPGRDHLAFIGDHFSKFMDPEKDERVLAFILGSLRDLMAVEFAQTMADFILERYPENVLALKIKNEGVQENPTELAKQIDKMVRRLRSGEVSEADIADLEVKMWDVYRQAPTHANMIMAVSNFLFLRDETGQEAYEFLWTSVDRVKEPQAKISIMQRLVKLQIEQNDFDRALATAWDMKSLAPHSQEAVRAQVASLEKMGKYDAACDVLTEAIDVLKLENPKQAEYLWQVLAKVSRKSSKPTPKKPKSQAKTPQPQKVSAKSAHHQAVQKKRKKKPSHRQANRENAAVSRAYYAEQTTRINALVKSLQADMAAKNGTAARTRIIEFAQSYTTKQDFMRTIQAMTKAKNIPACGLAFAQEFQKAYPDEANAYILEASFYEAMGNQEKAENCYSGVLRKWSANTTALVQKVGMMLDRHEGDKALFLIERARAEAPQNMQILLIGARIHFHQSSFDKAVETLTPVLQNLNHTEAILLFMACTDQTDHRHRRIRQRLGDKTYYDMHKAAQTWRINRGNHRYEPTQPNGRYAGGSVFKSIYVPFGINSVAVLQMAELPTHIERAVVQTVGNTAPHRTAAQKRDTPAGQNFAL